MITIVDIQGFKSDTGDFFPKEIAIQLDEEILPLLIKPPFKYNMLSLREKKMVAWVRKFKRFTWEEGYIPYKNYVNCIEFLKHKEVFVKGADKVFWLSNALMDEDCFDERSDDNNNHIVLPNVHNLEQFGCPPLSVLRNKYLGSPDIDLCQYHHTLCAFVNVALIKKWSVDNKIFK